MRIIITRPEHWPQLSRLGVQGFRRPKLKLRPWLASFFTTIGEAFQLAYVAPYEARDGRVGLSDANRDDRS